MIKHVCIKRLNGFIDIDCDFHEDINIITGSNGSGKTSIVKAIWYAISGNLGILLTECKFERVYITTDTYKLDIIAENSEGISINFQNDENSFQETFEGTVNIFNSPRANEINRQIATTSEGSIFLPTFRRIEGGFETMGDLRPIRRRVAGRVETELVRMGGLQEEIESISSRLSVGNHQFICSISTFDIQRLLSRKYTNLSEEINKDYHKLSEFIIQEIGRYDTEVISTTSDKLSKSETLLQEIRGRVTGIDKKRRELTKPFEVLTDISEKLFQHKGIAITKSVTIGESIDAIESTVLSAGEKQMLSFICYNAFHNNIPIFIDEPELSLHIDWQRQLFPILLSQETDDQYIIATHSPFIYSKYPEKEIKLSEDRGYTE